MKFITVKAARSMRCVHPGGAICAADGCMAWVEHPKEPPQEVHVQMSFGHVDIARKTRDGKAHLCRAARVQGAFRPGWEPNENKIGWSELENGDYKVTFELHQIPRGRCGWINTKEAA